MHKNFGSSFWGFWMLGGMAGGGMGFVFDPECESARRRSELGATMLETKKQMQAAVAFGMDPVVYDFAINEHGTRADFLTGADALLPPSYYAFCVPSLLRRELRVLGKAQRADLAAFGAATQTRPEFSGMAASLVEHLLPTRTEAQDQPGQRLDAILQEYGFDRVQHEYVRAELKSGRIGLAQNALPPTARIKDVTPATTTRTLVEDLRTRWLAWARMRSQAELQAYSRSPVELARVGRVALGW